jgi:pimeloyl-ACP methyl ester carboxylesterase
VRSGRSPRRNEGGGRGVEEGPQVRWCGHADQRWYVRGKTDAILPPDTQLTMARRARSTVINVAASHLSMLSHPDVTAAAIRTAAHATR